MAAVKLELDDIISVGFGNCYLLKNGENIWHEDFDSEDWTYCNAKMMRRSH